MTYEEMTNKMSAEDLYALLSETYDYGEHFARDILPRLEKKLGVILRKIQSELYAVEGAVTYGAEYNNTRGALALIDDYELFLRRLSAQIRSKTESPNTYLGYMDFAEAEARQHALLDAGADNISAILSPQKMFIRLPLLWSKINVARRGMGGVSNYENFYGSAVRRAIMYSKTFPVFEPYLMEKYEIFYLFVYQNSPPKIDNDNYATRDVTNAIASFLPGGDAPFACSFRYNSAAVNDIEEGTYVTVYPQSSPISEKSVMDFWRKYQAGKKSF